MCSGEKNPPTSLKKSATVYYIIIQSNTRFNTTHCSYFVYHGKLQYTKVNTKFFEALLFRKSSVPYKNEHNTENLLFLLFLQINNKKLRE
jgi:hypothetical protein